MSNTGKPAIAGVALVLALAVLLGLGWWALDRLPSGEIDRKDAARLPAASQTPGPSAPVVSATLDPQWAAELHASVQLLSETLATTMNLGGAIALIDMLDARIARHPQAALLAPLRAALAADRQKLVAARSVDIVASAAAIDQLVASVDAMPLLSAPEPLTSKPRVAETAAGDRTPFAFDVDTMMRAIRERFADVVRIRKVEHPEAVFLTPEQGALIAERLRLRLLSARIALVSRQQAMFAQDIAMAERILASAFDPQDPTVARAKASLAGLKPLADRLALPAQLQSLAVAESLNNSSASRP